MPSEGLKPETLAAMTKLSQVFASEVKKQGEAMSKLAKAVAPLLPGSYIGKVKKAEVDDKGLLVTVALDLTTGKTRPMTLAVTKPSDRGSGGGGGGRVSLMMATSSMFVGFGEEWTGWETQVRADAAEWLTMLLARRGSVTLYVAQLAWRRRWSHLRHRISWPALIELADEMDFVRGNCWALPEDHPMYDPRQRPRGRSNECQSPVSAGGITSGRSTPYPPFPSRGATRMNTATPLRSKRKAGHRRMR